MRTTVTLESDVADLLEQAMRERGVTFKQAINDAVRAGLRPEVSAVDITFPTFNLGEYRVALDSALTVAAALEDAEIAQQLAGGR